MTGTAQNVTIHTILDKFRQAKRSNREMGDQFERLFAAYLRTDPQQQARFEKVWMWDEWPDNGGKVDTGIDLVALERNTGEYCAIQCKFYDPNYSLQKADIDSFFTASGKAPFSSRIIVSTTDYWSKHAEDALKGQHIPVIRIRLQDLADSSIDWSAFSLDRPDKLTTKFKHQPRPHQQQAIEDVQLGFEQHDRGKLIMACGTGKTFTALQIAQLYQKSDKHEGLILFLVPSIALLNQTMKEWSAHCSVPMNSFAVCSDVKVGRGNEDIAVHDLIYPATTDAARLSELLQGFSGKKALTVVFSTYHSLQVIIEAQAKGSPDFDLIVCDEAHRTTGVTEVSEEESNFVRVHNNEELKGKKRLYMTATPRLYEEASRRAAEEGGAVVASMDNDKLYGPEFHRLGFGAAVEQGLLTDYKVFVLAVDEGYIAQNFQQTLAEDGELKLDDVVKIIGCWNGLSKRMIYGDITELTNLAPMQRAVAFAQTISASKSIVKQFKGVVDTSIAELEILKKDGGENSTQLADNQLAGNQPTSYLSCELDHVDGSMNALERSHKIDWLKGDIPDGECRILSNVRCLSEGVDVPALDAVLFLSPRNSVVDVVQSVGRVMRKAKDKDYGYVILPIGIPAGIAPEEALNNNQKYRTVWQVLQALRAHDDRFNATINKIELNKKKPPQISVIGIGNPYDHERDGNNDKNKGKASKNDGTTVKMLDFDFEACREAIFAKIVQKVGDRRYWEQWAGDVADIAQRHILRINAILQANDSAKQAFKQFLDGLHESVNDNITQEEAVEMLAQHLITKPVFDALFEDYAFTENNPVSQAMQHILNELDQNNLTSEHENLEKFYNSVRARAKGVDNAEGKQKIVLELYDTFFREAFPKMAERLGIVYTPVPVVDFIIHSVEHILKKEFEASLNDEGVQVLDPFTGTGTFIVRLLQSGLIQPDKLLHKYKQELHANEIVLLAYYIAAVNIEAAFHELHGEYQPFEGVVMTDTFSETGAATDLIFAENNKRIKHQKAQDIRVIIGNPPYSAGQTSQNDNNQNLAYAGLDRRIGETYAIQSTATNKNSLYDSYIRAIRWASDRVKDKGIVCFVTNGSFIDGNAADGLRKSLCQEFAKLYVFNLRGNQRTSGETSRREGGKIFGSGSRTPVAITLMIKDSTHTGECELFYHDIGDYLSREEKLEMIKNFQSVENIPWKPVIPNETSDWINQRSDEFKTLLFIGGGDKEEGLFKVRSNGLKTNRDAWVYNFLRQAIVKNMTSMIDFYNSQVESFGEVWKGGDAKDRDKAIVKFIDNDPKKISWSRGLKQDLGKQRLLSYQDQSLILGLYRPFVRQHTYFNRDFNDMVYQLPRIFPTSETENLAICITGRGSTKEFSVLMTNILPDLEIISKSQCFPLYTYETADHNHLFAQESDYQRCDNISDEMLKRWRQHYQSDKITKEDIFYYVYGLLHSPEYRQRFEADLKKMLPRLPFAADFWGFSQAGRELAELHVNYEQLEPYPLTIHKHKLIEDGKFYEVTQMKHPGKRGALDLSVIEYNSNITISDIPEEVHQYIINGKSALAWVIERYALKVDKNSGIKNNPNDWCREQNDPQYILRLIGQVVHLSIETVRIVNELPSLDS